MRLRGPLQPVLHPARLAIAAAIGAGAALRGALLRLVLADDGPGIAAERSERVFDPSERLPSRRRFLAASLGAGVAALLAACDVGPGPTRPAAPSTAASSSPLPSPTGPRSSPSGTGGSASPHAGGPTPTPVPAALPLERLVAGLLVVGFRGERLDDASWVREALGAGLGGVILFDRDQLTGRARNVNSPRQLRALTDDLRAATPGRTPVIAVDQEGGLVTRLSPAHGFPPVASEADVGAGSEAQARRWAAALAGTLADAGINLNLAPDVDLDVNPTSPVIGALGRSFSADADVVVSLASIEVEAHRKAGVATALKHFPGIGSATGNTDDGVVDVSATWTEHELAPFRRLVRADRADLLMVGHVRIDRLDPDRPASLSRAVVTDLLRAELGWDGPTVTDDLQAGAILRDVGLARAAVLALAAGNDLLLVANQQAYDARVVERLVRAVVRAVDDGTLDRAALEASWRRVRAAFP